MKTEEIKVRVEPLTKLAALQVAREEQLDLSDIMRRALQEYLRRRQSPLQPIAQTH
jgi:hypothetical protein